MKINEFIENMRLDDVDLADKLENLYEAVQISNYVYKTLSNDSEEFCDVENRIINILNSGDEDVEEYIDFIVSETESLYEQELIEEDDDWTAGLYNCDDLYLEAIRDVLCCDPEDENLDSEMDIEAIAYNAIGYMLCEAGMEIEEICEYIGCTEERLYELELLEED